MSPRKSTPAALFEAGFTIGQPPGSTCIRCPHLWGEHVLELANDAHSLDGGTWYCPGAECECIGTWTTPMARSV